MFWFAGLLALLSIYATWGTPVLWVAIVAAVVSWWTFGIAANHRQDPENIPNVVAAISMLTFLASIILTIVGFVIR